MGCRLFVYFGLRERFVDLAFGFEVMECPGPSLVVACLPACASVPAWSRA